MTESEEFALMAEEMLSESGTDCELIRTTEGAYDPFTGQSGQTTTEYTVKGFRDNYTNAQIDGTRILANDVMIYLSPFQTDGTDMPQPITSDSIRFAGTIYRIIGVAVTSPVGTNVFFVCQCRV